MLNGENIGTPTNFSYDNSMYTPFVFFGYELYPEMKLRSFLPIMDGLNGISSFEIRCLLTTFGNGDEEPRILIGFVPGSTQETAEKAKELSAYVQDNPLLDGITVSAQSAFYCGIEWIADDELDESESESDESDESDESESDESDESDNESK